MMREVEVYRLWSDRTWDLVKVFVETEPEPWNAEIIESRACTAAWLDVVKTGDRPLRMGLFTMIG